MKHKKQYEQPVTEVVELQVTNQLLTLSNPGDYGNGGNPVAGAREMEEFEDLEMLGF